jgi:DNA polymerase I
VKLVAFDLETHLIQPGLLAPPIVCASFADDDRSQLVTPSDLRNVFDHYVSDGSTFAGANIAYDFGCLAVRYPDTLPMIFDLYDQDRVWDVQIAEKLYAIGHGCLGNHPTTGERLTGYSLDQVAKIHGITDAKENDEWRLRYAELDGLPFDQWPEVAQQYPIDDAVNTLEVAQLQIRRSLENSDHIDWSNTHDVASQCRASWALHLGAIWGFKVDQTRVLKYGDDVRAKRAKMINLLRKLGFYRDDETKDTLVVARAVALAYGDPGKVCSQCTGGGLVSTGARYGKSGKRLKDADPKKCSKCNGVGVDDSPAIPKTEAGRISCSRDTLEESGSDDLLALAAYGEMDRAVTSYLPYLVEAGDKPLTLAPNNPLETGRTSYRGLIQLFPRNGGERECIVPRPGNVFYSVDYGGIELATHAQSCLWLLGESKLADVLNEGGKPHDMLAAKLARITDDEFSKRYKAGDKRLKALRQAAKPANFGFPGGMGAAKLVLQQRASGPDTIGPDGRVYGGLRFCILLGTATECGTKKVTEYKRKPCPPTCHACLIAAEDLRKAWFAQWPENESYFAFVADVVERKGFIKQHVSNRIRGRIEFTNGANSYFQGLAADGAKRALYAVVKKQYTDRTSPLFGSRTILFAHDELIGECAEETAHETVTAVVEQMILSMREYVPDVAVTAEPTLMRRWYKQAELTINPTTKRIEPWEPKQQ